MIRNDWGATVTAQEVFDHAVRHMLEQTERCEDGEACVYRGPKPGTACALGALLTDEEATRVIKERKNGSTANDLCTYGLLPVRLVPHLELCTELQFVHDSAHTRPLQQRDVDSLVSIAANHGLTFNPAEAR
jgi:hypothetical protein